MGSIDIFKRPCSCCAGSLYPIFMDYTELEKGFWCSWCLWKYDRAESHSTLAAVSKTWRHQFIFAGVLDLGNIIVDFLEGDEAFHRLLRRRASLYHCLLQSRQLQSLTSSVVASSCDARAYEFRNNLLEFVITLLV